MAKNPGKGYPFHAKTIALAALPFMGMISFWQVFDGLVPEILVGTFGLSHTVTGVVMALDNIFGLFLLPWFGIMSDHCRSAMGRRTPFILVGSISAAIAVPCIAVANHVRSLAFLMAAIVATLIAVCAYRTCTVAVVADITPRPLRAKADSVEKIVGYAGTGVMLVAIALLVPDVEHPNYLPIFLLQGAVILIAALLYRRFVDEPASVALMHRESAAMGIPEDEMDAEADDEMHGGKERIADPDVRRSMVFLMLTVFFYYMSYNGMTTNISRYAGDFFSMGGGSYAIINITTIAGALASYVPIANLSLKYGRKRVALITGLIMAVCPIAIWLAPGFHPALYGVFLLMGVGLGAVDICVYPMILENCSANSIGRYAGYYYTVSMAAQVVTPILSGAIMDVAEKQLFLYIALMGVAMIAALLQARHGDSITVDEVEARLAE